MDSEALVDTFALRQGTALSMTRVPKLRFLELPNITAQKRGMLSDDMATVTLLAIFNEDTTHIPAVKNEEAVYEEIYFFHVALKKCTHLAELNQVLQTQITNPAIIFYTSDDLISISAAPKRLSKQESGKTVADTLYLTQWLNLKHSSDLTYLQEGVVVKCSFTNLERFYQDFTNYVRHAELLSIVENVCINRRRDWNHFDSKIDRLRVIDTELRRLFAEQHKHVSFGEKLALRSKQVALENERLEVTQGIKSILEDNA